MAMSRSKKPLIQPLVLDASVILKWVLPADSEAFHSQAWAIGEAIHRKQVRVSVPGLWLYEVGNLLARKFPAQARDQLADLEIILGAGEIINADWMAEILRLVNRYSVTFYDAAYHGLAIIQNALLITADEKYLRTVGKEDCAIHLKDWQMEP